MKKMTIPFMMIFLLQSGLLFAKEETKIPECQAVFAACKAAGYVPGAHKKGEKEGTGTGLWVDCVNAVVDGKKEVPGVDKNAAATCKAAKMAKKASKKK